jgi:Nuclease-related domain
MAWQRQRTRKPSSLVTITERGGLHPEGARRMGRPDAIQSAPVAAGTVPAMGPPGATIGDAGVDDGIAEQTADVYPAGAQNEPDLQNGVVHDLGSGPDAGPPVWPGGVVLPAQRVTSGQAEPDEDTRVTFWDDFTPSEDSEQFALDADPDEESADAAVQVPAPTPASTPVVKAVGETPPGAAATVTAADGTGTPERQEGIGHRLGSLGHIFGHTRAGVWRLRAIIALVVFIAFTVWLNWIAGLTLAVLVAIADTIFRARMAPEQEPGTHLTSAQKHTQRQLVKLEKVGYRALHARLIPESEDHIDHLVIGPAGVFSIDSESWDRHLPIRTKNARQLYLGPFSMKERLEHARWESERAAELISAAKGQPVSVRPAMAVYGPKIPWDVATIRDVDVFSGGRLHVYLRRYAKQSRQPPLGVAEIARIYDAAHIALPQLDGAAS